MFKSFFITTNRLSWIALGLGCLAMLFIAAFPAFAAISNPQATNDATNVYYQFSYTSTPTFFRVYIDTDQNATTGFITSGIGGDYLLENGNLYSYSGVGGGWGWTWMKPVAYTNADSTAQWTVARADIGETGDPNAADLIFQSEAPLETSAKYTHLYSGGASETSTPSCAPTSTPTTATSGPIYNAQATNDAANVYYQFMYTGTPTFFRVYIDADQNPATGFITGGIGGDYLIENSGLYSYAGVGGGWGWAWVTAVAHTNTSNTANWIVARADIGETSDPNAADLIFQTEPPLETSAKYTHIYSSPIPSEPCASATPLPTNTLPATSTPTSPPGTPTQTSLPPRLYNQQASSDKIYVYYQFQYTGSTHLWYRVYLDTDQNPSTGFSTTGIGADYLLENGNLYIQTGGSGWNWAFVGPVDFSNVDSTVHWMVPRDAIGETATPDGIDLVFQLEPPLITSAKYTHFPLVPRSVHPKSPPCHNCPIYTPTQTRTPFPPTPTRTPTVTVTPTSSIPIFNQQGTNDATNLFYTYQYTGAPAFFRVYLDTDQSAATGFVSGSVGADYLVENNALYSYAGVGGGWGWSFIKSVTYTNADQQAYWTLARADVNESFQPNATTLLFQIEAPLYTTAPYFQTYSDRTRLYQPTTELFPNPERGFYDHASDCDKVTLDPTTLQSYRTSENVTLVMCIFYLEDFKTGPISPAALDKLQNQLNAIRAAGMKTILRFAYTKDTLGDDAEKSIVLAHLDQLAPYFQANSDVIYVMPAGFIGTWGEWYYTQHFGNQGNLTPTDWANRQEVVEKILSVLPTSRMIQLRTPNFKRTLYGTAALTPTQAYSGANIARIGHHNDCFLASDTDFGTYQDPSVEYPYLESETNYVPMGGETCNYNPPRSDCPVALDELRRFHWSYLNRSYNTTVLNQWSVDGCLEQVKRQLGYRFVLLEGTYSKTVQAGGSLSVSLSLKNEGWAAPFNPRPVELILRDTVSQAVYRIALPDDPRYWLAGTTVTLNHTLTLPANLPAGNYELLLNLPDPETSLASRPEYAIRFANAETWEASTGFNDLLHTVTVEP